MEENIIVSIIIPARNEEKYIDKTLNSLLNQDYPKENLEVLVMDGMSEDGTREIVKSYAFKNPFIKLLDNSRRITSCAFNTGIKNAKGEIIIIMSAHATYASDYVSKSVKYLREYNADNIGGVMIAMPRNNSMIGRAIVLALSNRFGVGNSKFRTGTSNLCEVDTVFGGCYKKEIFKKIGLFNEKLIYSQDMEFNLRLRNSGRKILLAPDIISYYYVRPDFKSFCQHNFRNGKWAILPFKYATGMPLSWRHLIPLVFVTSLMVSGGGSGYLSLAGPPGLNWISKIFAWLFMSISCSYIIANLYFSIQISYREKKPGYLFIMPFTFATLHITYGLGSMAGVIELIFFKQFWKNLSKILKN